MCIVQRPHTEDSTGARPNMTSVFDFDDSINTVYNAKTAGKNLVTAKHEVLTKAGDFLFLAHSDKEFALRCQMMEADIESAARRKMATVSDSKFKLVRALHEEWKIRHANCSQCNVAGNLKVSSIEELATELPEHRFSEDRPGVESYSSRTYRLHEPIGKVTHIGTLTYTAGDGRTAVRGHAKTGPNENFYPLNDAVVNEVELSHHHFNSDEAHEDALRTAINATKRYSVCSSPGCNNDVQESHSDRCAEHGRTASKTDNLKESSLKTANFSGKCGWFGDLGEGEECLKPTDSSNYVTFPDTANNPDYENNHICPGCKSELGILNCPNCGSGRAEMHSSRGGPAPIRCEDCKTIFGHSPLGGEFIPRKSSKTVEAHAGKKDTKCDECGATLHEGERADDVRGHLDICSKHLKRKGSIQEKIAGLKVRLGFAMHNDAVPGATSTTRVSSGLGADTAKALAAKYADRRADRPEMQDEAKAGRWAMITKHDSSGNVIDATLGRIGGSQLGGDAETSPLICTGHTHHGSPGCTHSPDDAFGGRHIGIQETAAMSVDGSLYPKLSGRKEGSTFAASHRVHILPQEDHDKIETVMNQIAEKGVPELGIPAFKREEEGRGKPIETFERGRESAQSGSGMNTEMGASHGVGKVSNFTIWPSTPDFGHFENEVARNRGKGENVKEILENGPRDLTGSEKTNPNYAKVVPGQEGKAGSGRVLPVATMAPMYNATDAQKGMTGGLADGTSAGNGVTARLRPVAWGNESDAPTFSFLKGVGKIKATGEALRQKLAGFEADRQSRVGAEKIERAKSSPSPKAPTKNQVGADIVNRLLGKE